MKEQNLFENANAEGIANSKEELAATPAFEFPPICAYKPAQTLADANAVMRKLRKEQREIDKIHAAAEVQRDELRKELAMLDEWEKSECSSHSKNQKFFESLLVTFVGEELKGSKKKSLHLVGGTAGWGAKREEYLLPSDAGKPSASNQFLLELVKKNGLDDYVETKEAVKWAAMKKHIKASSEDGAVEIDGVTVHGIEKRTVEGSFYVKLDAEPEN